jgi:hypothetical protein
MWYPAATPPDKTNRPASNLAQTFKRKEYAMKSLIAALYAAALLAYLPSAVACADENGCANRPDAPKTRALKPKPQKEECEENSCN